MRVGPSHSETFSSVAVEAVASGSLASVLSTVALLWLGQRQSSSALAPVNAISHWLWGDSALRQDGADARHTLLGYGTHHVSSVLWALVHAAVARKQGAHSAAAVV